MDLGIARILDANANRAREALRVMEDYARFVLNDSELSGKLKSLRHALRTLLAILPDGLIEANRDTRCDVGTAIVTEAEGERGSSGEVVIAAGKRLSEALRCLEEYGKIFDGEFAKRVEGLRYDGYELEKRLQLRIGANGSSSVFQWKLCVLITEGLCRRPWLEVLDAVLEGGADCVQLREKDLPDGKLLGRANVVVRRCGEAGVASVINDRVDIAMMVGATGVHVGQADLPIGHVRKVAGRTMVVGVSTSNVVQAEGALRSGADYVGIGPMFETGTKETACGVVGLEYAREFVAKFGSTTAGTPAHLAIGGIGLENLGSVLEAGLRGVAVSSAICGADDPRLVVEEMVQLIGDSSGGRKSD